MATGKDRSSAIAICVTSTGLKMEKGEIEKLLDKNNITESNRGNTKSMKIKYIQRQDVQEQFTDTFKEASIDPDNNIVKGVCLFGTRESANNRIYSNKAIASLTTFSEGVKCFINHPGKSELKERDGIRDLRDWVGVYENAHQDGDRIFADLRCREAYWDLVHDVATLQPKQVGNSINAQVKVHIDEKGVESVIDAALLRSVDLVSNAATTTSLFESAIQKNLSEEEDFEIDIADNVTKKFDEVIASEGIIQDKLDNDKLKYEVSDITYIASDMIGGVMRDDAITVVDKKAKVMKIFDDLSSEIKKRLTKIKKETTEKMDLTLEMVKGDKGIMEALLSEFKEREDTEKIKADVVSLTEANTVIKKEGEDKDKVIGEKDEKIAALETEIKNMKLKIDEIEVAEKMAEKRTLIQGWIDAAELPKELVTKIWFEGLLSLSEKKGNKEDEVITLETQVKEYIEDRRICVTKKPLVKNSGDEFVKDSKESGDKKKASLDRKDVEEGVADFAFKMKK